MSNPRVSMRDPANRELIRQAGCLARVHRTGVFPPLSVSRDLDRQLSQDAAGTPVDIFDRHPVIRTLNSLAWPGDARAGLVSLLLRNCAFPGWEPPRDSAPSKVERLLGKVLPGEEIEPKPEPVPIAAVLRAVRAISGPLIELLKAVGPAAVARDPGLPLRLLHSVEAGGRTLRRTPGRVELRIEACLKKWGRGAGSGGEYGGITTRGNPAALLPTQLAQESDVFAHRACEQQLLYRERRGRLPPRLRPTVIVLDVSPPTFGPVEGLLRPAAHALARMMVEAGQPAALVTAGGEGRVIPLERGADLVAIHTLRARTHADVSDTVGRAVSATRALRGAEPPLVLLLTHARFGSEAAEAPAIPGLRGLFVHATGQAPAPPWADRCERVEVLGSQAAPELPRALGRLLA